MESTRQLPGTLNRPSRTASNDASRFSTSQSSPIHAGLFTLFAIELFALGAVLWAWIINRQSFPSHFSGTVDWIWGLIGMAAAGWGTFYLSQSWQAAKRWEADPARNLLAISVGSGAVLLGVLVLNIAREFVSGPVVMDARPQFAVSAVSETTNVSAVAVGDAANGKEWFLMTCVTCHGPTGDGVLNAAPSLRASDFLKNADATQIASLIRLGRAANDPANKSGKVMPARGGNPFLGEDKIADLAAFLKQLDTQFAGTTAVGSTGVSTDFSNLQLQMAGQPAPVIRNWTMDDFTSFAVLDDEESVNLGMQAFVKASCNKCHMAEVEGLSLGPTLDLVVKKYKRDDLLRHVIEPSFEINEKFQSESFLLLDGQTVTGIVVSESEDQVELLTDLLKPDQRTTIPVEEIEARAKSKLSPMPTGLADVLTPTEIEGLVAYVDAVGRQLEAGAAMALNHWVVPNPEIDAGSSVWVELNPVSANTYSDTVRLHDSMAYQTSFSWLFVAATSVLSLHFLWLTGTGAAVVMHRELQLSARTQRSLSHQTILFWSIGLIWLVTWFVLFFLWG